MVKKSEKTGVPKRKAAVTKAVPEPKSALKTRKSRAQSEDTKPEVKPVRAKAKSSTAKAKPVSAKAESRATKKRSTKPKVKRETKELEVALPIREPIVDPIGDVSDGEGRYSLDNWQDSELETEAAVYRAETADDAIGGALETRSEPPSRAVESPDAEVNDAEAIEADAGVTPAEPEIDENRGTSEPRPPARLERLQKILSQAGIASRRHAEEMIQAGRVLVNGQVVTQLGAKADAVRDHIRVDGKMITGAERHRYFVLNKPKGYVTTVSDPEGRPTVMQFFSRINERLYPVGRLDYDSEGLLLVTNDGLLANQLTRAATGIEKTYLVKIAGRPTEDELEQLRSGVAIEREGPGSGKVHTAPAQIRQVRQGDNPWYEVVLTEGRNRELRKMFQSIGHFVEKIRRVGYGPLVLDLEPGKLRELTPEEVSTLRLAAEGKWKPRSRRTDPRPHSGAAYRPKTGKMLRREEGQRSDQRHDKEQDRRRGPEEFQERGPREFPQREFGQRGLGQSGQRPFRRQREGGKPFGDQPNRGGMNRDQVGRSQSSWKQREDRPGLRGGGQQRPFGDQPNRGGMNRDQVGRSQSSWKQREDRPGLPGGGQQRPFRDQPNRGGTNREQVGRNQSGWKQRQDRPGLRGGERQRPFSRSESGSGRGPRFEDRPRRDWDKPRAGNFEGRRTEFNRPPRGVNQRRGEDWKRDPEQRGNRDESAQRGRGDSERAFRGPFKPASAERRAPEAREGDREGARTPRGFSPGRFSKPDKNRSGFKPRPGRDNRGGPPKGGRGRG